MAALAPIKGAPELGRHQRVRQRTDNSAEQIEDQEFHVPHGVLDIVAEDPEEQHVAEEMQKVAM